MGILGRNGAGKTTLLDVMLGMKYPSHGEIKILGENPNLKRENHGHELVYLSQDIQLNGTISVEDFFIFHSFFYKNYSREIEEELLDFFKLEKDILIGALSTGQQKKVQIIAGLASDTKIILIDEITAVLDPEMRYKFFIKLKELNIQKKKTILLATNIAEDLKECAEKILYLNDHHGEIISPQKIDEIFKTK